MIDPALFETDLLSETAALNTAHPDRYKRFLIPGSSHTILLGTINSIGGNWDTDWDGISLRRWVQTYLDGTAAWENVVVTELPPE